MDEDVERRRMLRMKVKQGVLIAENLKKRLREPSTTVTATHLESSPSSSTSSLSLSPTINHPDDRKESNLLIRSNCSVFFSSRFQ